MFTSIGLEVHPGDIFEVPDELAAAFTVRADIEPVAPPSAAKRRTSKADTGPTGLTDDTPSPTGPAPDPTSL
jgi:hypothetical protein